MLPYNYHIHQKATGNLILKYKPPCLAKIGLTRTFVLFTVYNAARALPEKQGIRHTTNWFTEPNTATHTLSAFE